MIKRKWSILFLLGLSFASVCQAGGDIDALYSRIAQKDIQALNELKALAKDNNAQALAELGFIYEYGVSVSVDIPQAIKYYEQACDLDGDYGCFNAAYFYEYGIGTQKDITQAKTLAKQLREKINLSNINLDKKVSERIIGSVYSNKLEAYRDLSFRPHFIQGLSFYFYAPQSDERKLLSRIGFDSSHLARIAILWAREGDPEVAYQTAKLVSTLYFNNETKTIDIAEALKWLRISAEKGDADSQTLLGFLYEHAGLGLQPDGEKARKWYEMAAQQGNGEALYTLGRMYYSGVMVNVDYDKALYFFKKAYEKELQAVADYLAQMYFNGQSVDVDCQQSWHYYDNSYIKKMTQRDYLDYCEKDRKRRNDFSQQLPELTLEKYAGLFGRIDNIPLCQIGFVVNTNKLIHVANLRVELILKNDAGVSDERMVAFPPLGLNTLGAEQGMGDSFKSMGYLLMKNGDLCDYHKLTFTVKSATATINGKKVDLLKTDNLHIIQNR